MSKNCAFMRDYVITIILLNIIIDYVILGNNNDYNNNENNYNNNKNSNDNNNNTIKLLYRYF